MRRMLLYAMAVLVGLVTGVFSWALSEARLAVASFGVACVAGLCWAAQRFPRMRSVHLLVASFLVLVGSIVLAVLVPSTPVPCICPVRQGGASVPQVLQMDRHMSLRLAIFTVGSIAACVLAVVASRRATADDAHDPSPRVVV